MNILPLVSAFILLFAMGSYALIHQVRGRVEENVHYKGSMRIQDDLANQWEKEAFRAIEGKLVKEKKEEGKSGDNKEKTYESWRDKENLFPESRLNLTSLVSEESPQLRQIALNLLRRLYQFTSLYQEMQEEELLEQILSTLKERPSVETFADLLHDRPDLYKFVKGTHKYHLSTSEGYPPLGDFFSLDLKEREAPIHFTFASRPVLLALFDDDRLVGEIWAKEKEKWEEKEKQSPLTKAELEAFLTQRGMSPAEYFPLLYFNTSRKKGEGHLFKDDKSRIQVKIPVST